MLALGVGFVACGGLTNGGDDGLGGGGGMLDGASSGGALGAGGASPGGGESSGGVSSGGESSGGESSGGESSGGESSGGGPTGGVSGGGTSTGGQLPDVPPESIGHVEQSCGAYLWSLDGTTFLSCGPGDADAGHPDCVLVDCTGHGDTDAICIFSNHCQCTDGFVCDDGRQVSGECDARASCVPE